MADDERVRVISHEDYMAASKFKLSLTNRADAHDFSRPLWHGWAIMDAFFAGIEYGRANPKKEK